MDNSKCLDYRVYRDVFFTEMYTDSWNTFNNGNLYCKNGYFALIVRVESFAK